MPVSKQPMIWTYAAGFINPILFAGSQRRCWILSQLHRVKAGYTPGHHRPMWEFGILVPWSRLPRQCSKSGVLTPLLLPGHPRNCKTILYNNNGNMKLKDLVGTISDWCEKFHRNHFFTWEIVVTKVQSQFLDIIKDTAQGLPVSNREGMPSFQCMGCSFQSIQLVEQQHVECNQHHQASRHIKKC